jgi:DNA sulfur modification protein DndB
MLRIPALHGKMGEMDYYLTVWTLGEAARNLEYSEEMEERQEGDIPAELRSQRKINWTRVRNEIVPYLTQIPDHFFSSLTVEVIFQPGDKNEIKFEQSGEWGYVLLDGTEALRTLDGQHRLVAIKEAVKEAPALAAEKIAVILVPHQSVKRSQQVFSDLNRNAKSTTKALNVLFEWRGLFEQAAKKSMVISSVLKDRVELEKNSLARKSPKFITLGVLYEMSKTLLDGRNGYIDYQNSAPAPAVLEDAARELADVFDEVIINILPEFDKVLSKDMMPHEYRSKYIAIHSVGWQSMALAIRAAIDQYPDSWKDICREKISEIDWRITNPDWEGTAVSGGMVNNRTTNIRLLSTQIKELMGLELSDTEKDYFSPERPFPIKRLKPLKR